MVSKPSLVIVEDNKLLRLGIRVALEKLCCCSIVGEACDGDEAVREVLRLKPDAVLMDVGLPGIDGIEATWRLKRELPRTRIIMFTSHTEPKDVMSALGAGAEGYCAKATAMETVAKAIEAVMNGEIWIDPSIAGVVMSQRKREGAPDGVPLSDVEIEILELIRQGVDNSQIALDLQANTQKLARIMGTIISKFVQQATVAQNGAPRKIDGSADWLKEILPDTAGARIFDGKYLIENLLGCGGVGAVYRAKHLFMDRPVALKLIRPELSEDRLAMRNFQREAMAVANLHHKNVIDVYDFGIGENNEPFMVMEYVSGKSLAEILKKEGRLTVDRALKLAAQICSGMAEAHLQGVVHCDLKPSNILIAGSGPSETVKIVDFGLAQMLPKEMPAEMQSTSKFYVSGTPYYMAPEQCLGGHLDARSDIYSLGCVIFESLTGTPAINGKTPAETFEMHCRWKPPSMGERLEGAQFPPVLEQLVAAMLEKEPGLRPQQMDEVRARLDGALAGTY